MDSLSSSTSVATLTAPIGSVQAAAGISVMKKAANLQASAVATLLQAVAPPSLATSGSLGTQLDTYA